MQSVQFFLHSLRNLKEIGAVLPSSRYLANRMLKNIDFTTAETFVELGAGTGALTSSLISQKKKEARLWVFEPQKEFASDLEKIFAGNGVSIICEYADKLPSVLEQHGVRRVDAVISSLPLAGWNREQRRDLFKMIYNNLWREGIYTQYQYFAPTYLGELREVFRDVTLSFEALNVPPAVVYVCKS